MARDIERHLHDEAVEACPPSAGHRLRKLVRRHRTAMTTGAMFALLLMAAIMASTWMAVQARRAAQAEAEARHRVEEAQKEAKRSAASKSDKPKRKSP